MKRTAVNKDLRRQVFERDHYTCRYCGSTEGPFQADHVYPFVKGGETTIANLVTACPTCNNKKGSKVGIWPRSAGIRVVMRKLSPSPRLGAIFLLLGVQIVVFSTLTIVGVVPPSYSGVPGLIIVLAAIYLLRRGA